MPIWDMNLPKNVRYLKSCNVPIYSIIVQYRQNLKFNSKMLKNIKVVSFFFANGPEYGIL